MIRKVGLAILLFALGSMAALAADFNGKWTANVQGRKATQTIIFNFHVNGESLTGKMTTRHGDANITNGKVDGNTISFTETVTTKKHGAEVVVYTGTADGDTIKFSRQAGKHQAMEFVANRAK